MHHRLRQRLTSAGICALVALMAFSPAWADPINLDQLKRGMSLDETVRMFGQPLQMEWLNLNGQAVLFLFYEGETCSLCLEAITGQDVIQQPDGRIFLPMGFIFDALSGWGRKYYEGVKLPSQPQP